jgi:hypothetical protein
MNPQPRIEAATTSVYSSQMRGKVIGDTRGLHRASFRGLEKKEMCADDD